MRRDSDALTDCDLLVVGGGSAGFAAALRAAELGAKVTIAEAGIVGGTCVNVGCVPSKTLIRAAEAHHRRAHHGFLGVPTTDGRVDWLAIRHQKDALVTALRQAKYLDVLREQPRISLIEERVRLVGTEPRVVLVGSGRTAVVPRVVLATGAKPWAPSIPGLGQAGYLDSASAMALSVLPDSLIVIGGSAVGLELAQMFARLGTRTTVMELLPRLVPGEDPEIGDELRRHLTAEGIEVHTAVHVVEVRRDASGYTVTIEGSEGRSTRSAERLLVATGRRANTEDLGLDAAGVTRGPKDAVQVNEFLQTTNPAVYAAGDVIGDPMFVYVAAYAGTIAATNALQGNTEQYDLTGLPRVTFTDPAVAAVGLTAAEARQAGMEVVTSKLPLQHLPRALAAHDTRGFVKLVAEPASGRLVGAHILAAEAGEMIMPATLAVRHGLSFQQLAAAFYPYLTLSEGIRLAAQAFTRDIAHLSCCAG
jgi:mercuric reductase